MSLSLTPNQIEICAALYEFNKCCNHKNWNKTIKSW